MSIFSRKTVEVQEPLLDHTVYLIDTENVRTVWTLLLDRMTINDKIYVFYTMNSGNVSYEDLNGVLSSGKSVELIQCHTGKNGLDFQLVSYLGYLIRNNENADYCIISDDSGYDAVIKFWEGRDVDVTRKTAFQVSGKQAKPVKKPLFGGKSRNKAQPVKQDNTKQVNSKHANVNQANVNKANVKATAEVADAAITPVTAKVQPESEKKVRASKQRTEAENKAGSAKTSAEVGKTVHAKYTRQIKADAINENTSDSDLDDIFKDEPVRLTPVNPDEIKFVAQHKRDDTMQSSSDKDGAAKNNPSDEATLDKTVPDKTSSEKKASTRKNGSEKSVKSSKQESTDPSSKQNRSVKSESQAVSITSSPEMLSKLRGYLPEEPEDRIGEIAGIIAKSGGKNGLADIHDEIEKLYRNEKASDVYRAIRKNINDICC